MNRQNSATFTPGGGEWKQAQPVYRVTDVWRLERLTHEIQAAYNTLAKRGEIFVEKITVSRKSGMAVVEYNSALPPDWTRQALRQQVKGDENAW